MKPNAKKIITVNRIYSDNLGDQFLSISLKKALEENISKDIYPFDLVDTRKSNESTIRLETEKKSHSKKSSIIKLIKKMLVKIDKMNFLRNYIWVHKNKRNIEEIIKEKNSDILVIGGGELLQDNSYFPIAISTWTKLAKKQGMKIYILGVGFKDKYRSNQWKLIYKSIKRTDKIYLRDEASRNNVQLKTQVNVNTSYDVAFFTSIDKTNKPKDYALLGVTSFRRYKKHNEIFKNNIDYFEYLKTKLLHMNDKYGKTILFYTDQEDYYSCIEFQNYLKKMGIESDVAQYNNLDGLIEIVKYSKFLCSARMHACIIGKICGVEIEVERISLKLEEFHKLYIGNGRKLDEIRKTLIDDLNRIFIN